MDAAMISTPEDFEGWLLLAKEVEPLFGPMVEEPAFREGLRLAIMNGQAKPHDEQSGQDVRGIDTDDRSLIQDMVRKKPRGGALWCD